MFARFFGPKKAANPLESEFAKCDWRDPELGTLHYRFRESKHLASPLVIYLHGAGGAGQDNCAQLQGGNGLALSHLADPQRSCNVLAPQCPRSESWWNPQDSASRCAQLLLLLGRSLIESGRVDPARIYLVGVSMGAHGCWDLAWREPDLFAALVSICGACPPQRADRLQNLPCWGFHGTLDQEVPYERTRQFFEDLQRQNSRAQFTELPGVGHRCTQQVFEKFAVLDWLLQH